MIWELLFKELVLHMLDRWLCFIATLSRNAECLQNPNKRQKKTCEDHPDFSQFPPRWGVPQRTGPSYRSWARPTSWRIQWSGRPGPWQRWNNGVKFKWWFVRCIEWISSYYVFVMVLDWCCFSWLMLFSFLYSCLAVLNSHCNVCGKCSWGNERQKVQLFRILVMHDHRGRWVRVRQSQWQWFPNHFCP